MGIRNRRTTPSGGCIAARMQRGLSPRAAMPGAAGRPRSRPARYRSRLGNAAARSRSDGPAGSGSIRSIKAIWTASRTSTITPASSPANGSMPGAGSASATATCTGRCEACLEEPAAPAALPVVAPAGQPVAEVAAHRPVRPHEPPPLRTSTLRGWCGPFTFFAESTGTRWCCTWTPRRWRATRRRRRGGSSDERSRGNVFGRPTHSGRPRCGNPPVGRRRRGRRRRPAGCGWRRG